MVEESLKQHLCSLEEQLLQPGVRKAVKEVNTLLADDFIEFGSSGRIYNKRQVIEGLASEPIVQRTLYDFQAKVLSPEAILVTYRLLNHDKKKYSLRSSIWKFNAGAWQMLFHQGTESVVQ